jgi:hypothetical protein
MSRTIEAIMRHMVPPVAWPDSTNFSVRSTNTVVVRRKPERKLSVVFAPPPLSAITTPNH